MITANGIVIKPTIFPDGTSQIWKLPTEFLLKTRHVEIDWRFESEREIIDLFSLRELLLTHGISWSLYVPFLPYARQDKEVLNDCTFNLAVIAKLINQLGFQTVKALDVHNPKKTASLIERFENISVENLHKQVMEKHKNAMLVYPDKGAFLRYDSDGTVYCRHRMVFQKVRDQLTGKILGHSLDDYHTTPYKGPNIKEYLIIDDLCDGGATFISIANKLKEMNKEEFHIYLFVTHGVFSKTLEPIHKAGIATYTTDSLIPKSSTEWNAKEIFKV